MNIEDVMRRHDGRLEVNGRCLIWADGYFEWRVYAHEYGARNTQCLYRGDNLSDALDVLVTGENQP